MNLKEFEQTVLELARTTRVPLTKTNIVFYTGTKDRQAEKWLDHMAGEGLLDFDSDDDGEMIYTVRGSKRPADGATELRRCSACGRASAAGGRCTRCGQNLDPRLRALSQELGRAQTAISLFRGKDLLRPPREGEKNLLSAGLWGLLGPPGWLYAAPVREAAPAAVAFVLVFLLIPKVLWPMLLFTLLPILPVSALIGVLYAWKYNRAGHRSGLLTDDSSSRGNPR